MLYGEYVIVEQHMQPQMMHPQIIAPQQMQPQDRQPQMMQTLPPQPDPQPNPRLLEVAVEVLDLAESVLNLEQDRRGPTWPSLERGTTPTSPFSDGAFNEDEIRI